MPSLLPVTYTSVAYIYQNLPEIGSISNITSSHLAFFAGKAEAEINARINKLYSIPIGVDVPILTALATELTVYYALSQRPLVAPQTKSDPWLQKFKEARDMLNLIAKGEVQLLNVNGGDVAQSTDVMQFHSNTMNFDATFHEGDVESWLPDPEKIRRELAERGL